MNLMIVEDEVLLRNSIMNNIDWAAHEIEIVGTCSNGMEAWLQLDRVCPDIILLDIQMPEMDGLTFTAKVAEKNPDIRIILMSGHDDFEYAQRAIGLRVSNYLLKPAGDVEILKAVLNAADDILEELEKKHHQSVLQQKWQTNLPRLQEMFLQNWIHNKYEDWEILRKHDELMIELPEDPVYCVVVAEMDPLLEQETRFGTNDQSLLQFSLQSIAKEFFLQSCQVFTDWNGSTIIMFAKPANQSEQEFTLSVHTHCSKFIATVQQCLKLTASAGIGGITKMDGVPRSYQMGCLALQMRVIYGNSLAIPYTEPSKQKNQQLSLKDSFVKELTFALETGHLEARLEFLSTQLKDLLNQAEAVEEVKEMVFLTSALLIRWVQTQMWSVKVVMLDDYSFFANTDLLVSKEQISQWFDRCILHITDYLHQQSRFGGHQLIKSVYLMVQELMEQEVTLQSIAAMLFVNSSYLSRLFKQETGKPFSTYVLEKKMERASTLLSEGAKVYDTARMVGYRDVSYFTKVFRKYWGMTPGEVRK